ncbi:MAG: hypothetical protein GTO13_07370 [Proteobacteria bacterium]|nr:hypothetical protein [Pseudomonadota bacterium]
MKTSGKITLIAVALFLAASPVCNGGRLLTGLERNGYTRLTSSSEISGFLAELSSRYTSAERVTIATSALGSPVEALLISSELDRFKDGNSDSDKITVMLVGSQHGTETSGAEALLLVARDVLEAKLGSYREDMDFVFIPNSNPDGRNLERTKNGNGININRNYTILSEPESRGIINAMHRWRPEVVLDVHESAVLKKKSLARQGYLTDFEAQFEAANNPNVDRGIRIFSFKRLLPEIIARVKARGLAAQRYVKEITSIHQPITHGGLTLRNLRNMAGMLGAFSFLLENRLDPSTGTYPTPRNIRVRVSKQYLSIMSFLESCRTHRSEMATLSRNARMKWKNPHDEAPLYLAFSYVADPNQPEITLPLRKIDTGELIRNTFRYHGSVESHTPMVLPSSYVITDYQELIREILSRNHIHYQVVEKAAETFVKIKRIKDRKVEVMSTGQHQAHYSVIERTAKYLVPPGDLVVNLNQPARRLIALLLEIESFSSIFNADEYLPLVEKGNDFFINYQ